MKSVWRVKQHSPPAFFYRSVVDEERGVPVASERAGPSVGALGGLVEEKLTGLEVHLAFGWVAIRVGVVPAGRIRT